MGLQVEWEEYWWEASDWAGMKELGAEKSGCSADGAAWRETWREAIAFDPFTGEPTVERTAHKWAHDAKVSHHMSINQPIYVSCLWGSQQTISGEPTVERTAHKWAHDAKGSKQP